MKNLAENLQFINEYIIIKKVIRQRKNISYCIGWKEYSFNIYRKLRKEKHQVRKILKERKFTKKELKRYSKNGYTYPSNNNKYNITYTRNKYSKII